MSHARRLENHEHLVGDLGSIGGAIGDDNHRCTAGLDLLDVAEGFLCPLVVAGDDRKQRCLRRDECERAMFELIGRESLGGFVADPLAFEITFEGDRDVPPVAGEKISLAVSLYSSKKRIHASVEQSELTSFGCSTRS